MSKSEQIERFVRKREELGDKLDRARSLADIVFNAKGARSFFSNIAECPYLDGWTPSQKVIDVMMDELRERAETAEKELNEHEAKIEIRS